MKISLKSRIIGWFYAKRYAFFRLQKRIRVSIAFFKASNKSFDKALGAMEELYPAHIESTRFYQGLLENSVVSSESYDLPNKTVTIKFEMK